MSDPQRHRFPDCGLVVGVTGHRDLREEQLPELSGQVRDFFLGLRRNYPRIPLTLLSPLASGADQLVTQVAQELGVRVVAVLPVPVAMYRDDFDEPGSQATFDHQLAHAEVLELPILRASHPASVAAGGHARDLQYAQAGIFASSHCHVLLALWDGEPSGLLGGTAQVVAFHLQGDMPEAIDRRQSAAISLGLGEESLVHHIPVSRRGGADVSGAPRWLTSGSEAGSQAQAHAAAPPAFDQIFRRHAEFLADRERHEDDIRQAVDQQGSACPIQRQFVAADWLATTYRRRVSRVLLATYLVTALMGFSFIAYADLIAQDLMLYVFLALFAVGVAINALAQKREWHRKYIDYRALAEGLRVQSYWRRAGIVDSSRPSFAHDNFLQKQDVELGWIRNVMRGASVDGMLVPLAPGQDGVAPVIEEWIGTQGSAGQLDYYLQTAARRAVQHRRTELLASTCLWSGISLSLLLALFARLLDDQLQNLMVAAMGALSLTAAVHEAYAYKKADKELIKQYRFMARIFSAAQRRLSQCRNQDEQRQILRTLGEAALAEHAEWTLMHRERPLEHSKL
ncbi:MAG: hypothetical protein K0M70_11605 [Arenimonas sp.]|uniref:hypothetical protein n=1 Tax=Arenimonas sp. TaxID=1872635 RepID=UPI0025B82905|nr:hypothetical protein [Arenimonas sp.]MBW8368486.1 hypothetical protein [Arenimonas sp.]